jgi:copper transport protein
MAVAGAALLVLTPGLAGHASTQDPGWLILPSNVLHVIAMAIWGGGLLAMFAVLPAATSTVENQAGRSSLLLDVTRRFSMVALGSVILVALTGIIQSIVEVGSFPNLVETAFGRSVLIKTILFAVLVGLGWQNRSRIIPAIAERVQRKQSPGQPGVGLRRNLRIEVLLIIATLGVTAALVSYPPSETESSGPASGAVTVGSDRLDYTVDPATIGPNEIHIYLFDGETGAPVDVVFDDRNPDPAGGGGDAPGHGTAKGGPRSLHNHQCHTRSQGRMGSRRGDPVFAVRGTVSRVQIRSRMI